MSFYKQPLMYLCGPFALKYALVMLGKMEDEKEIEKFAGTTWWYGTDELGLAKAANHYDCELEDISSVNDPVKAIESLKVNLKKGFPAILCVDKWGHWITIISHDADKYVCVDSGMRKVIIVIPEKELLRRWKYIEKKVHSYSGYILHPWYKERTRANFTAGVAKKLMSSKYEHLALRWDAYFNVLAETARNKKPISEYTITFKEFLRRNQKLIVELVADWQDGIEYKELDKIFENFKFIAEVYDLVIHMNDEKTAIINFTSVLMLYATTKYGTYSYL